MASVTWYAIAFLLLLVPRASAQDPQQRLEIEQLRATLAGANDTVALSQREAVTIQRAKADRENPMLHLELGFIAHRLGELTGAGQHYDDAGSEFEWAAELRPEWPYAWYGLGLAELAAGESHGEAVENIKQMLGKDYLSKAANAFGRAARADPGFAQAVVDLALTAMRQRIRARLDVARAALREAAGTDASSSPELQLARGRVEREAGEGDSALVAFARFVEVGGDSGLGMLETARTYFYLGQERRGAEAYEAATRLHLSPLATALCRGDLAWIATPEELREFDALTPGDLERWVADFWKRRDTEDGRRRGERLVEHYRRYFYAMRHYRLVSVRRHYDITERFRSGQQEVDDRGVIYLRHGEPDRKASYLERSVEPNESWLYRNAGGDRVFHFVARDDVQDFKLVESLADALGLRVALALGGGAALGAATGLFESRSGLDPLYQRLASLSPSARTSLLAEERTRGQETLLRGTTTDSYTLRFQRDLKPTVHEMAVTGASGESRLLIPFALPGAQLVAFNRGAAIVYPVELRVIAQRDDGLTRVIDTVRTFSAGRRVESQEQLTGLLEIAVPPGTYRVRVIAAQRDGDAGGMVQHEGVRVPPLGERAPGLSDLVVGQRGVGPVWLDRGDSIPVSALPVYPEGSTIALYFEVHGVPRGTRYRTNVEVTREGGGGLLGLFRGRGTPVGLEYDGVSDGEPTRVIQALNVGQLSPGRYRLRLRADLGARDARHTRFVSFAIAPRRSG
jgi:GWxTD domain-containing protein